MAKLRVEVVYALPARVDHRTVQVPAGASVMDCVRASGILERHPELGAGELRTGVFGERRPPDTAVSDGDRVEIYRPLAFDPLAERRRRARSPRRR